MSKEILLVWQGTNEQSSGTVTETEDMIVVYLDNKSKWEQMEKDIEAYKNRIKVLQNLNTKYREKLGMFTPNGNYVPIRLDEEWLAKLGYDLISENHYGVLGHLIWKIEDRFYCDKNGMQLKYVHQLQNLYFALTGSELTVA